MSSTLTRAARVLRRRGADRRPRTAPSTVGLVEEFTNRVVLGWVSVPADAPPVQVSLHLGKLKLATTYVTADGAMSAAGRPPRPRRGIAGPAGDRRNSPHQIRSFSFRVRGIWPYVRKATRITVRVAGRPLPIAGHGMYLNPPRNGRHTVKDLRGKLESGHVLTQFGSIALSKKLDTKWQRVVMDLHSRTHQVLQAEHGLQTFLVYGTLLGHVRENGFIGHDADFDAAYVSAARTAEEAAAELEQVALTLVAHGLRVEARPLALHVDDPELSGHRIDIFHTFFDEQDRLRFPFGVAGSSVVTRADWEGTEEVDFAGGRARVPVNAEQVVALLYGDDWRRPKPGFNWHIERADWVPEAALSTEQRTKVYWASFYSRNRYTAGSTFFDFVDARDDTPATIIDIGCGDGRDACAFGGAGRRVLGLDQSPVGIEHAAGRAASLELSDRVAFRVCDVADVVDLGRAMDQVEQDAPGPVLFYLRFFLHAIPAEVQDGLMEAIAAHARPGDVFAAEFRTDRDEANAKVHTKHYRRFQNAESFREALVSEHGFEVLHFEEGTGLSPYQGEDPVLCRVVARRP